METLLDLFREIERLGDREAIRFFNGFRTWKLTYRDLYRRIAGVARHLDDMGLSKGDRLILWGESSHNWVVVFWAAIVRGIELVPVDYRSSYRLVQRIQDEVEAKLLVHGPDLDVDKLDLPKLSLDLEEKMGPPEELELMQVAPDDVVEIVYTSGTTGEPKGVVHRHRNICSNLRMFQREINKYKRLARPFQPIRILDLLPLSHLYGQSLGIYIPILLETSVAFTTELHPVRTIETIRRERVSVLVAVPKILSTLRQNIERRFELSRKKPREGWLGAAGRWWRHRKIHSSFGWKFWALLVGGARLPPEEEEFWWRLGFVLIQGYGLTETSPVVTTNHPLKTKRGSIGYVVDGQDVKIAPDGEILVRGESVVTEYFRATKDSDTRFREGWLHTGDIGELDAEGRMYYRGRKKDVIVTADGLNVFPQDVEAALNQHPEVKESVVLGIPSKDEELVHAVILPANPIRDVRDIVRQVNQELEPHQLIRKVSIWPGEDFPRTASTFKIKRGEVRSTVLGERHEQRGAHHSSRGYITTIAQMVGRPETDIEPNLRLSEDLGLSSLDRVELISQLEIDYGLEIDEGSFASTTVGEIASFVQCELAPTAKPTSHSPIQMPRWPRVFPIPLIRHGVLGLGVKFLWNRYIDFTVAGLSNLSDIDPPIIFAANHASHLDTIAILMGLPFPWRRLVAPAMQQEHFRAYFEPKGHRLKERTGQAIQYVLACGLVGAYPLPRQMAGVRQALEFTGELVEKGYCPLVYPEGERTRDGAMHPFKPGIALMAQQLKVPVVPIHLEGMSGIYSIHHDWPETGSVLMRLGAPMHFVEGQAYDEIAQEIEMAVTSLGSQELENGRVDSPHEGP